jgi:drug/metabolite transporter (DMT)-like permease
LRTAALRSDVFLLITAAIWGFAFVAQRAGMDHVGPLTFNGVRFALGVLVMAPIVWVRARRSSRPSLRVPVKGALAAGAILFLGAALQQSGMVHTSAGKGGFITGLYMILVPILGLFVGHRPGWGTWVGAAVATVGLYFLSAAEGLRFAPGDGLVLAAAFFWAVHVLLIARLSPGADSFRLAMIQYAACSILSFATAFFHESITVSGLRGAAPPLLYAGLVSVGIAYTLQVVAQRHAAPAHAAMLMSTETVFAALGGWWVLSETLGARSMFGCALMLAGILVAQVTRQTLESRQ